MQQSSGNVGNSKHRKAFVHGHPGENSKRKGGPKSWYQKWLMWKAANVERKRRHYEMVDDIRKLWNS